MDSLFRFALLLARHYKKAMLFDLHVHSSISPCSRLSLDEILNMAGSRGLDGVCITDHDTMEARKWIDDGLQANGLCVIVGQEYTTPQGDFLLFGPYEHLPTGLSATRVLNHVRSTGGAAIAAHPFRSLRPVAEEILSSGLCRIIEAINGRNTLFENTQASTWLERYPLCPVGGSDAHTLEELGRVPVWIDMPVLSRADLTQALHTPGCVSLAPPAPLVERPAAAACA